MKAGVLLACVVAVAGCGLSTASVGGPATPASLCLPGEEPVLSCAVEGGKLLSLCGSALGSKATAKLQYRFGRKGAVELSYPSAPASPKGAFFLSTTGYSGGGEERIRFRSGGFDYSVFQRDIAGDWREDGTREHFQDEGVVIEKAGKVVGKRLCAAGVANDGFPKMYDLLERETRDPLDIPCCGEK